MIFFPLILLGITNYFIDRNEGPVSVFESYVFVTSSMINFGYVLKSEKLRKRVAFLSIAIEGILMFYHWEAELTSHLAFKITNQPFNNLEEFSQEIQVYCCERFGSFGLF